MFIIIFKLVIKSSFDDKLFFLFTGMIILLNTIYFSIKIILGLVKYDLYGYDFEVAPLDFKVHLRSSSSGPGQDKVKVDIKGKYLTTS